MTDFKSLSALGKALSDLIRLKIINLLSCDEMCACELLEKLSITQPTLSHHMKVLTGCGLVRGRKDATWMHYTLNGAGFDKLHRLIDEISAKQEKCACYAPAGKKKKCNS
ncbi:MAG: hypothetical protein A2096_01945 [Spirochaetes bacterium GWF1_41_5]|nr:MAG: hypothetical protein A2096_01945 [Spirochaetes bacterium GWF1_41_5]HBE03134.1 transcriptional regulator [Spirochaetia bacterium]